MNLETQCFDYSQNKYEFWIFAPLEGVFQFLLTQVRLAREFGNAIDLANVTEGFEDESPIAIIISETGAQVVRYVSGY